MHAAVTKVIFPPATGIGTSPAIVYITEVAKPELRGALIATCPTLASFGKTDTFRQSLYLIQSHICFCCAKRPRFI